MKRLLVGIFIAFVETAAFAQVGGPGTVVVGGGGSGGGVTGLTSCVGGTAIADNAVLRGDGTDACQGSSVTVTDGTSPLLQLGGTTSSFPSIKRNSANIDIRLADDSGYAGIQGCSMFNVYDGAARAIVLYPTAPFKVVGLASDIPFGWSSGTDGGTLDTGLSRDAADVVKIDSMLELTPIASGGTCDAAAEGRIYNDSSHALCWCDGTTAQKLSGAGTCD